MKKINANTRKAIEARMSKCDYGFYIGAYYYSVDLSMIRRIEQKPGYTPTSEWQVVARRDDGTSEWVYA